MVNINIPLPASCSSCPLSVRHFGKLYCPALNDRVGNEGKDSRCPLVDAEDRGDLISRADAIDAISKIKRTDNWQAAVVMVLYDLPSAQPEPSIPLSWIEAQIEWLKSLDNAFADLTAGQISAMVNKWKDEQDETE